jgi:hypothetical protein
MQPTKGVAVQIGEYLDGRSLNYNEATFVFDIGGAPVSAQDVFAYDAAGQVHWLSDELRDWALAMGQAAATSALSGSHAAPEAQRRGRLLGFRSHTTWKMAVSSMYYLLMALLITVGITSVPAYANSARDVVIDVIGDLLMAAILLSPALLLSDFAYRDKLPLFKHRKPVLSAIGLVAAALILSAGMASAENLHSESYKVAAEAERRERSEQREAEEAAEKAEEEAEREAAAKKKAEDEAAAREAEEETASRAEEEAAENAAEPAEPEPAKIEPVEEPVVQPPTQPAKPALTMGQQQAVAKGRDYLDYTAFSRQGLIDQLVYEGFSTEDATFAVDYIAPDWNEQAAKKAQDYLDTQHFSRSGLMEQLLFEGFTHAQAAYGVSVAY